MRWLPTRGSARSRSQLVRRNNSKLIKPIVHSAPAVPPSLPTRGEGMGQAGSGAPFPGGALPSAWHSAPGPSCSCGPVHPHCHLCLKVSLCLSFPSCCQEKPLSAWLNLPSSTIYSHFENPCPDAVGKGDGAAQQSGIFWGCWMGCGGSGGWRNRGGTCRAMPCCAIPAGPHPAGDGDVGPCFAALRQPHGWSCQATAGWRRGGNKAGTAGTLVPPSPPEPPGQCGPAKAMGSLAVSPQVAATIPARSCRRAGVLQGDGPGEGDWPPGEGDWHLLACPEGARWG